eukprot:6629820-Heterocapsa_arctica.AAC.1
MADDIEATEGHDPHAPRLEDEMVDNELYRRCIENPHIEFFGSANPSDEVMYTKRGMLAAEVTK